MAGRKEYEMLFQLNAQLGGSYSKTFKAAQQEIVSMQKEIQALSKTQADISAFQKQQAAVEATRKRLEMLRQQYDNIQREMEETGNESVHKAINFFRCKYKYWRNQTCKCIQDIIH